MLDAHISPHHPFSDVVKKYYEIDFERLSFADSCAIIAQEFPAYAQVMYEKLWLTAQRSLNNPNLYPSAEECYAKIQEEPSAIYKLCLEKYTKDVCAAQEPAAQAHILTGKCFAEYYSGELKSALLHTILGLVYLSREAPKTVQDLKDQCKELLLTNLTATIQNIEAC